MTKSLLTVRIGVTVTHVHDRALAEQWSAHIMAVSALGSSHQRQSVRQSASTAAMLATSEEMPFGSPFASNTALTCKRQATKPAEEEIMLSTHPASTSAKPASSVVGSTLASSTVSNLTCKCQATKPSEEETMLSTPCPGNSAHQFQDQIAQSSWSTDTNRSGLADEGHHLSKDTRMAPSGTPVVRGSPTTVPGLLMSLGGRTGPISAVKNGLSYEMDLS